MDDADWNSQHGTGRDLRSKPQELGRACGVHLPPGGVDLIGLRSGNGRLDALEELERPELVGALDRKRVLHLQCHFGADTLALAQRGARVTGVGFSGEAVRAATVLAAEPGLSDRASFIECNVYDTLDQLPEIACFDLVCLCDLGLHWLVARRGGLGEDHRCLSETGRPALSDRRASFGFGVRRLRSRPAKQARLVRPLFRPRATGAGRNAGLFECRRDPDEQPSLRLDARLGRNRFLTLGAGSGDPDASRARRRGMAHVLGAEESRRRALPLARQTWLPLSFTILAQRGSR